MAVWFQYGEGETHSHGQSLAGQTPNLPLPAWQPCPQGLCYPHPVAQLESSISSWHPRRCFPSIWGGRKTGLWSYCLGGSLYGKPQRLTVAGALCSLSGLGHTFLPLRSLMLFSPLRTPSSLGNEQDLSSNTLPAHWSLTLPCPLDPGCAQLTH